MRIRIFRTPKQLLPQSGASDATDAPIDEDHSWHASSFELARGLDVIEHCDLAPALFADNRPSFRKAEA